MTLTIIQEKALAAFAPANQDIDIVVLYGRIYGDPGTKSVRDMQMKLAPLFRNVNARLKGKTIELGEMKRTYRLTTNKKA